MPGVQTLMPVLLRFVQQGRLSLGTVVRMACERPAALYGIEAKGGLGVGMDADLALWDLDGTAVFERGRVQSRCGWSPYEGETLAAAPEMVVVGGRGRDGGRRGGRSSRGPDAPVRARRPPAVGLLPEAVSASGAGRGACRARKRRLDEKRPML